MMMNTCFWALLSVGNLQFISTSSYDKLRGQSLFDIIHPDEVSLAKRDLYKFMDSNILGGSVTRCRVEDYSSNSQNNNSYNKTSSWIVVDIIMYVATENLVLAFFHRQYQNRSVCGDHDFSLADRDFTLRDLKSSVTMAAEHHPYFNNAADSSPHQFFHILDNRTKSVLLSWPDHYPNEIINYGGGAQMDLLDDRPMSPNKTLSCFHCVQNPIRTIQNKKIDSLVIEYGSISFLLIHMEEIKQLTLSSPSSPTYKNNNNNYYYSRNTMSHRTIEQQQEQHRYPSLLLQQDEPEHHYYSTRSKAYHHPYGRSSAPSSPIRKHRTNNNNSTTKQSSIKLESLLIPVTHQQHSNNNNNNQPQYQLHQRNQCQSCGTSSSPEWRRGPTGHKTLCNACGLRYSRSVARQGKMANQQQQQQQQRSSPVLFHPKKKSRPLSSRSTSPSSPTFTTSNSTSPSSTPRQFNISELININY